MPHGRVGGDSSGGGTLASPSPGTFSATASTTSSTAFGLSSSGFLTELSIRVDGDPMASTISGGPVKIEVWLGRGAYYRKLGSGGIQNEFTVKGSGMIPVDKGDRIIIKWQELSGSSVTVRVDAYVDENASGEGAGGWQDETPKTIWFYQARRALVQDGAGGGALAMRMSLGSGMVATNIQGKVYGPVTNTTLVGVFQDEDGAECLRLATVGAGASNVAAMPSLGANAVMSAAAPPTFYAMLGPGQYMVWTAAGAAQTESLTVAVSMLLNQPGTVTFDSTGSAGTPNLGASSISAANTWALIQGELM